MIEPFRIAVSEQRLHAISEGVERFDWSALPDSGVGLSALRRLVDYWRSRFDWRATERRLNEMPQFTTTISSQVLHFVHGWPGSFIEFIGLIQPLTSYGNDVVVPSLPGYAFSGRPSSPQDSRIVLRSNDEATASDGICRRAAAAITSWLAYDWPVFLGTRPHGL